jgi:hypothetical protein
VSADTTDVTAVRVDDALLDALGGCDIPAAEVLVDDDELNALLWAWRRKVDTEPMAVLVDTPQAVALLAQNRTANLPAPRARADRSVSRLTRRTR